MKKTTLILIVAGSLSLTACSSLRSEFVPPDVEVPSTWRQKQLSEDIQLSPWWESFNDPKLTTLVETVLQENQDLALATLVLKRARLQQGLSETMRYPDLSSSSSQSNQFDLNTGEHTRGYQTGISLGYEVDLWGKVGAEIEQASWLANASKEDRERTAQTLVATTASLYWQIAFLKERVRLSDADINGAKKTLALIKKKRSLGAVSDLDVLEATRNLASLEASASELQQSLLEANNALAILFDAPPKSMGADIMPLKENDLPSIAVGVPADVLIRRPDVKSALYSLRASLASKDVIITSYFPSLSLTGSLGTSSVALRDLLSNPVAALGASISLPFLNWRDMQVNKAIADVDYETKVIQYRKTLYQAFYEVDNALSAREAFIYQYEKLKLQYQAAKRSLQIYESQYRNGVLDIMTLLDAQENERHARVALLENYYNQLQILATIYQAIGGEDVVE